jgi:hypothetical protein
MQESPDPAHTLQLPARDGCDMEEPAREQGFPSQRMRAAGQNSEHRAGDLYRLDPIARAPKR